jgi:hypothetical protein
MFQTWRLTLREAGEAYKAGDLAEASRLLSVGNLTQFLPGKRLAEKVATRKAERATDGIKRGELDSAWGELEGAVALNGETSSLLRARQQLVDATIGEIIERLRSGDARGGLALIESLERRKIAATSIPTLRQVALRIQSAANLAKRGKFADAETQLIAALKLRPDLEELEQGRADCRKSMEQSRGLTQKLHRAMSKERWSEAVSLADAILELAPESALARDVRKRAWAKVGAKFSDSRRLAVTRAWSPNTQRQETEETNGERFLLWVDGVGGYLVCLSNEVVLGQAAPGNRVDVPILADISRRHAKVRREGEGYVVEPLHVLRINGESVQNKTLLSDGDEIELGSGVRFQFRRPHALSASARIDLISRHRTQPFADSILLMAESCVLGPRWQNHVVCQSWDADVVLYRQDDELYCRAMDAIEIDGELCDGRGRLNPNSHVAGSDFSMSLEELDRCTSQPLL